MAGPLDVPEQNAPTPADSAETGPSPALREFEAAEQSGRDVVRSELDEALARRKRNSAWLLAIGFGPATAAAIALALIDGSRELAIGFGVLGAGILLLRTLRDDRRVKELERELVDPMDGS
jgi:hypothetical protein